MINRTMRAGILAAIVLGTAVSSGTREAVATTTQASLSAALQVVSTCAVSKTSSLSFAQATTAGIAHNEYANGSITYACQGTTPKLSAADSSGRSTFELSNGSGNTIAFSLCAVESGESSVCTPLENGNKNQLSIPASGTQTLQGMVAQNTRAQLAAGYYTDHITVSLEF